MDLGSGVFVKSEAQSNPQRYIAETYQETLRGQCTLQPGMSSSLANENFEK